MNMKTITDGKGHVIGREINNMMLDSKGKVVARYIASCNLTLDGQGKTDILFNFKCKSFQMSWIKWKLIS